MNKVLPMLNQLMVLHDLAPPEIQLGPDADARLAQDAERFYGAVHAALPTLITLLADAQPAPVQGAYEPSIEAFRRVREVLRAAHAWHARTPAGEAALTPVLDAAIAAWADTPPKSAG